MFRLYVFGLRASGLWLLYVATLQNLIPSFPWIAPPRPPGSTLAKSKERQVYKVLPSGNLADRELEENERTFDPDNMRNFVDVYIREMEKANRDGRADSTFFGGGGRLQFANVITDLLAVCYTYLTP